MAPAGPADLPLPPLHLQVEGALGNEEIQVASGPDGQWVSLPLRDGSAPVPFHLHVLSDLWSLRIRVPAGSGASVAIVPDETLVLVPPGVEPPEPLSGLEVANWGEDTRIRVRALDRAGQGLPVLSVNGRALKRSGSWYVLGVVPSGLFASVGVDLSGTGACPVTVEVRTDDGRTGSYTLRSQTEALNTTPVAWPSETIGSGGWTAYTQIATPIRDRSATDSDPSTGGTTPQQDTDITRGGSPYFPSALYAFDATNQVFYYRIRVGTSPMTNSAQANGTCTNGDPWDNITWNLLIDTDGDGYKEFTVVLDGDSGGKNNSDISASAGTTDGDDLKVYYDNLPLQTVTSESVSSDQVTTPGDLVWWGNAGTKNAAVPPNPSSPADGAAWDFGRTRCVYHSSSNGTWGAGWFVDFQFPLSALTDAWNNGNGGRQLVGVNTPIAFGYSTSNSNSNPLQKDYASAYAYTASGTTRFPFSDIVTLATGITQYPQVGNLTLSNVVCPTQVNVSATIADALQVSPPDTGTGTVTDTIASVTFQWYADLNGNGLPDDGSSWTAMATVGSSLNPDTRGDLAPDGVTPSFNDWGVAWNTAGLPSGQYLIRVTAVDDQGHTTTKTVGSYVVDASGANCRQGINASWASFSDASHLAPSSLFSNTPPATVYMNGSFSPATTYNVAYYDSTGALIGYSAVTSDTFGTMLSSQLALTATSPAGTYHSVVYPVTFTPPGAYNGTFNTTTNPLLADCPFVVQGPPAPVVNSPIVAGATSVSGTSTAPAGTTITVYRNGTAIGTTTVQSDGTWTLTGVTGLLAGDAVTAKAGTGTGQGPVSNTVIVVAASVPPIVTASLLAGGAQTIYGSSVEAPGSTITVYVNGSPVGTTTVAADGSWSFGPTALAAGQVVTAAVQAAGKAVSGLSNPVTVASSGTGVTPAPEVTPGLSAGATTASGTFPVATSGVAIDLYADGYYLGTTTTDAYGNWTLSGLPALAGGTILTATATQSGSGTSDWSAPVVVGSVIDLLRDDSMTTLNAPPASIFTHKPMAVPYPSLEPLGANHVANWGEGALQQGNGTSDDDRAYLPNVASGTTDPDPTVLTDHARPLVFYQLLDNGAHTLYLKKASGQIVVTIDAP